METSSRPSFKMTDPNELKKLPSFNKLLRDSPVQKVAPTERPSDRVLVSDALDWVVTVCAHYSYSPVLAELSIIADKGQVPARSAPFFATFIKCFADNEAKNVLQSYLEAMAMMVKEQSPDPLIPHFSLYQRPYLLLDARELTSMRPEPISAATLHPQLDSQSYALGIFEYTPGISEKKVKEQLNKLVSQFLRVAGPALPIDLGYSFLVVPFWRPYYEPLLSTRATIVEPALSASATSDHAVPERQTAMPGGALFLLCRPTDPGVRCDPSLMALELGSLLTRSVLASVVDWREADSRVGQAIGFSMHGILGSLEAMQLREVLRSVLEKYPTDSLLASKIRRAMLGDASARGLAVLTEMITNRTLPSKCQSNADKDLYDLLTEAAQLVTSFSELAKMPDLSLDIKGAEDWILPAGYFHQDALRGLLGDLLKNCIRYGQPSDDNKICVRIRVCSHEGKPAITIAQPIANHSADDYVNWNGIAMKRQTDFRASFLIRFQRLCAAIGTRTMQIESAIDNSNHMYLACWTLGDVMLADRNEAIIISPRIKTPCTDSHHYPDCYHNARSQHVPAQRPER